MNITSNMRKDIPKITHQILRGGIAQFVSLKEDRFINASNAYLHVLDAEKETIAAMMADGKSTEMLIKLEVAKKITTDLVKAFDDFYGDLYAR
tara:strand:- start:285 stop:563 length:279 start_codon:yes stop_codon:yes gene_type:complete